MITAWHGFCAAGGLLAVSACQPLPHPFADDRPPASLLTVRDSKGVSVAPIAGEPHAAAVRLRAAVAKALQKDDIPASDSTASITSYQLAGRIEARPSGHGRAVLTVHWRLTDGAGHVVAARRGQLEASSAEWQQGSEAPVDRLAAASAEALMPLLTDTPPRPLAAPAPALAAPRKGPVVLVAKVGGAPGDGDAALTDAMVQVLRSQQIDVVTGQPTQKPDLTVEGRVAVTPVGGDKQHVAIVWALRRADGSQVGTVGQQNDVPRGSLDHRWGDVAYTVAVAARSGILQLVIRAESGGNGKKS